MDDLNCMIIPKKKPFFLFTYLFSYYSNELYKKLFENDKDKFEAELGNLINFITDKILSDFFSQLLSNYFSHYVNHVYREVNQ